jgi:probable rRNA maturation factor
VSAGAAKPSVEVDVVVEGGDWSGLADPQGLVRRAVTAALAAAGVGGPVGVCVLLTDDETVADLNRAWRGKEGATDVLSFPAPPGFSPADEPRPLGDIALADAVVRAEARARHKALENHVAHLIVHGVLHLVGHDHVSDEAAAAMEALEVVALAGLGIADPYERDAAGAA